MNRGTLFIVLGVALVVAGVTVIAVVLHRRLSAPVVSRSTRAAIDNALRAGWSDDPRIDAHTRATAARTLRQRRVLWVLPFAMLLYAAGTVTAVLDADSHWWDMARHAVWLVLASVFFAYQLVRVRRSRRYLQRQHPGATGSGGVEVGVGGAADSARNPVRPSAVTAARTMVPTRS